MSVIKVSDLSVSIHSKLIFKDLSFELQQGRNYAVVGPSGSGKTTLLRCLAGLCFYKGHVQVTPGSSIVFVEQQHHFKNLSNTSTFYHQQRFNSADTEDAITVQEYFEDETGPVKTKIFDLLGINKLLDRRLIQLSNGENKRVQLAGALLQQPDILLLDNPLLGLDVETRGLVSIMLESISKTGITIIMITGATLIPDFINEVWELKNNGLQKVDRGNLIKASRTLVREVQLDTQLLSELTPVEDNDFTTVVKMKKVRIQYGDKVILDGVNWEVKKGERWALSGPNGAGKSTLLSLINADNPQAYANEIYLFEKRRGRGESIWDIKKRIGHVSPELHLYFDFSSLAFEVVASGLFDTIGLFKALTEDQVERVKRWIKLLNIEDISNQRLTNLPLGKQRLVLLARALVKNPPLLLLDEPVQGLDEEQSVLFKNIIQQLCEHSDKSLIYVTHLKEEIPSCVTRFIRLEEGKRVD